MYSHTYIKIPAVLQPIYLQIHPSRTNHTGLSRTAEEGGLELENALLSEKAQDKERQQRAKRARLPAYSGKYMSLSYMCMCILVSVVGVVWFD